MDIDLLIEAVAIVASLTAVGLAAVAWLGLRADRGLPRLIAEGRYLRSDMRLYARDIVTKK